MTDRFSGLDLISDVEVAVTVELGRTEMPLRDVLGLVENAIVPLDRQVDELLDIYANGKPIAKGEVVSEGGKFALRIVELAGAGRRADIG